MKKVPITVAMYFDYSNSWMAYGVAKVNGLCSAKVNYVPLLNERAG